MSDGRLRELFLGFIRNVASMHQDIRMQAGDLEIRMMFKDAVLCRVVPYRELMHVQIGDYSGWEIRVRDEEACLDALDMSIRHFLRMFSSSRMRPLRPRTPA
ncbi:MAG: hypothetical protein HY770_02400 [Chitinivibrionia bacterium]|nr:hypothetical protein [Chitinivibrionia bacterium]